MQKSTKLCRTLHRFTEGILVTNGVHWGRRWQDGQGSGSFLPAHSETFQSISKHFVTSRCHLLRIDWAACVDLQMKPEPVPPAVDRFPTAGSWAKQKRPPLVSMAARCAHAGLTSRRARQSSLPDRKAARGRDGRGVNVGPVLSDRGTPSAHNFLWIAHSHVTRVFRPRALIIGRIAPNKPRVQQRPPFEWAPIERGF
jgi:hypothetical protein